jgi:hypothetical protein
MVFSQTSQSIAAYDNAPFFEKAFRYAVQHNVIDQARIDEIINDAATGSIQIAEYFGDSTHLRNSLEVSMQRMVRLVSLYLEDVSSGALDQAAQLLKEKPFRTLSRGGSQMLKQLYSLPEDDHFNSPRLDSEREFLKRSLVGTMSISKYRQALETSEQFKMSLEFSHWLMKKIGAPIGPLNELHASAEHVVRTALLVLAYGAKKVGTNKSSFPDEAGLFEIFSSIRKEWSFLGDVTSSIKFLEEVPVTFQDYAKETLASIKHDDVPKIVNQSNPLESVFNDIKDRQYCYLHDDIFAEVSRFDKSRATEWTLLVRENDLNSGVDHDTLYRTLFLSVTSGLPPKAKFNVSEAKKAVINIRENGLLQDEVFKLIDKAPHEQIAHLQALWGEFVEESTPFLLDHTDEKLNEVMTYLYDRCNIQKTKK